MKILEKVNQLSEPFKWLNFDYLPDSQGHKIELYPNSTNIVDFMLLFHYVFEDVKNNIVIRPFGCNSSWGDFCLDTWNVDDENKDFSMNNKSELTNKYLKMLNKSNINPLYVGSCKCNDWDKFLPVILECIFDNVAMYSLLFYVLEHDVMFYFHHTHSIGIYYKDKNVGVQQLLERARSENLEIIF